MAILELKARIGGENGPVLKFKGRQAWALSELTRAGERGVTPIEVPGPRWSDYVFKLRREGVAVETIDESHAGPYAGTHARYKLATPVTIIDEVRA
ncbi:winged helix domain-containing protein [Flaviflagellibacter deserti]|uniref:Winged helix domain-containing protein n=1 Tax=Flaviflagellibacter deserti TaxID=2267266 RepID=A0ABV9Z4X6_9HYPH